MIYLPINQLPFLSEGKFLTRSKTALQTLQLWKVQQKTLIPRIIVLRLQYLCANQNASVTAVAAIVTITVIAMIIIVTIKVAAMVVMIVAIFVITSKAVAIIIGDSIKVIYSSDL